MENLVAIDVALLPPADVIAQAIAANAALPRSGFQGLRLDDHHLPHVTLTQQFVDTLQMDEVFERVEAVARRHAPIPIHVTGAGRSRNTVWMAIEKKGPLAALHQDLMNTLLTLERSGGSPHAFVSRNARPGDVAWVGGFRQKSSFDAYVPHVTIGHSTATPSIEARDFSAARLAVCHLGRFCTCRKVFAEWVLR